ncbi:Clp protease N-terminal domain-containing protein [Krasilnikoviella flava]|uniref:Clp amino terminal domain-containing protein, pathogenicity island component n=1 Tax=Krasilnikoviella flava TaxID=526729 RepID=A0A1T5JFK7_9MICO|nr:Clp protease N-terminal domain-containing protein [Krasilnikoviella flava]SKC50144.1 Clp amino terminal domain-containing protein, pathogenicity island component [Krasilnikoviella flava]
MFEKFTKDARAVVQGAVEVAERERSESIDTRHLVVTLAESTGRAPVALAACGVRPEHLATLARDAVRHGEVLDAEALAAVGIDLDEVSRRADEVFGTGALERAAHRGTRRRKHWPFTADARKALELSLREAIRLGDKGIDDRHLLLGVLRADCPGGRLLETVLHEAGSDVAALRSATEQEPRAA